MCYKTRKLKQYVHNSTRFPGTEEFFFFFFEMITLPAKGSNPNNEASQEIGKPESQDHQYHKVQETTSDGGEFQLFCDHCRHDVESN